MCWILALSNLIPMVSVLKENKGVKKTDIKQIIVLTGNSREKLQKLMGPGSGGHTWYRDLKKLS